jgi:hypothetical protein
VSLLLALLAQAAPVPPPVPPPAVVPNDLTSLPPLPWRVRPRAPSDVSQYVAGEVAAERCPLLKPPVTLEFAVLVRSDGSVRAVLPLAINCVTVEQYGAGVVSRLARGNLRRGASGWYRAALVVPPAQ